MDSYQVVAELKALLQARTWDGTGSLVFGASNVVVSYATDPVLVKSLSFPAAIIIPGDARADPEFQEEPGLFHMDIAVRVGVSIPGDAVGEAALMGAALVSGASPGRGLLQLARQVRLTLGTLTKTTLINIKNVTTGWGQGVYLEEEKRYLGFLDVRFLAVFTDVTE